MPSGTIRRNTIKWWKSKRERDKTCRDNRYIPFKDKTSRSCRVCNSGASNGRKCSRIVSTPKCLFNSILCPQHNCSENRTGTPSWSCKTWPILTTMTLTLCLPNNSSISNPTNNSNNSFLSVISPLSKTNLHRCICKCQSPNCPPLSSKLTQRR